MGYRPIYINAYTVSIYWNHFFGGSWRISVWQGGGKWESRRIWQQLMYWDIIPLTYAKISKKRRCFMLVTLSWCLLKPISNNLWNQRWQWTNISISRWYSHQNLNLWGISTCYVWLPEDITNDHVFEVLFCILYNYPTRKRSIYPWNCHHFEMWIPVHKWM